MRHIRSLLIFLVVTLLVGTGAMWIVYRHYAADLPDFQQLADYQPATVSRVQAGDGRLIAEYATEKRVFVPVKAMPPLLIDAVLAAEDRDFYHHGGIDFEATVRAVMIDVLRVGSGRRGQGASTITQQMVKNFLLGNEYSLSRKIKEAILAFRVEQALSKDRILELYLNEVYFGSGAYGIAAASLNYFNKSLDALTVPEAAFLAGCLQSPGRCDPTRHYDEVKARRDYVIDGLAKIGAITEADAKTAQAEPIVLHHRDETEFYSAPYFSEEVRRELIQRFGENAVYKGGLSVRTSLDPILQSYADKAFHDGLVAYDRRHGWRGPVGHMELAPGGAGWEKTLARATLPAGAAPWKLALALELKPDGVRLGLVDGSEGWLPMSELTWARPTLPDQQVGGSPRSPTEVMKRGDLLLVEPVTAPKGYKDKAPTFGLRQIPNASGAVVALDPHTGRILALTGGWSYEMSQFDRATQARRQIGSTMKPFVYLAALENGMTPSTLISGLPVEIDQGPNLPKWSPKNFEGEDVSDPRTLRWAIEHSINTMTVRMASTIGIDKIAPYVERLGIMDHMPLEYSMVLGAGDTTPLKLTAAYGMLVNGGKKLTPSLIDRVQDRNGQTIFRSDARDCPHCADPGWAPPGRVPSLADNREQVLDPGTAYQMVNILVGVVQRGTAAEIGAKLKYPLAGKTGTTNGPTDTWFVGFSPDLVVGTYIGFDEPRSLGREQGASVAVPVFAEFMTDALKGKAPVDFRIPPEVRLVRVNADSGRLAEPGDGNVIWEAFKPGTEPSVDGSDETVVGDPGIETVKSDPGDAAYTPDSVEAQQGVLVAPVQLGDPAAAPRPKPVTVPSTGTGGLY